MVLLIYKGNDLYSGCQFQINIEDINIMRIKIKLKNRFYFFLFVILSVCFAFWVSQKSAIPENSEPVNVDFLNPEIHQSNAAENSADHESKFKVCLDAGHGGHDAGTKSILGFEEKDLNLAVALAAGRLLEKEGYEVIYTRTEDEAMGSNQKDDLKARCAVSNEADADIFISIHCNFDERSKNTRGTEVWCRFKGYDGERLAECIRKQFSGIGFTKDRGIKYEKDGAIYVLKNTDAPAVLIELGFLSNSEDSRFLNSKKGQNSCAQAILAAVNDYVSGSTE